MLSVAVSSFTYQMDEKYCLVHSILNISCIEHNLQKLRAKLFLTHLGQKTFNFAVQTVGWVHTVTA